jgi:hypothetical protein
MVLKPYFILQCCRYWTRSSSIILFVMLVRAISDIIALQICYVGTHYIWSYCCSILLCWYGSYVILWLFRSVMLVCVISDHIAVQASYVGTGHIWYYCCSGLLCWYAPNLNITLFRLPSVLLLSEIPHSFKERKIQKFVTSNTHFASI